MPPKKSTSSPKVAKKALKKTKSPSNNDESNNNKEVNEVENIPISIEPVTSPVAEPLTSTARKRKRLVVEDYVEEQQTVVLEESNIPIVAPELIITSNNETIDCNSIKINDATTESNDVEIKIMISTNTSSDNATELIVETIENDNSEKVETIDTDAQNKKKHKSNNDHDNNKGNRNQQERKVQKVKPVVQNKEYLPHEANIHEKTAAVSYWDKDAEIVEITQMRGNFWRTMGFSRDRRCLLYPEEALYLIERGVLLVQTNKSGERVIFSKFYEEIIQHVQLEVYQAFVKLKTLEYVAFRHKENVRCFNDDRDVYAYMKENRKSLLDSVVSFDLHLNDHEFSKKGSKEKKPVGYVVVLRGDWTFSARLMISLLDEAKGVPIIFAAVMPSGNVLLEEFTDALDSLNWENIYARAIDFRPEESSDEDDEDDEDDEVKNNKSIVTKNEVKESNEKSLNLSSNAKTSNNSSVTPKNNKGNKRKFENDKSNKSKDDQIPNNVDSNNEDKSKKRRKDDEHDVNSGMNSDMNTNKEEVKANEENTNTNTNSISIVSTINYDSINIQNSTTSYNMIEKLTDDGIDPNDIMTTLEALRELMDT